MKKIASYLVVAAVLLFCAGYVSMDAKASVSGQVPSGKENAATETIFNAKSVRGVAAITSQTDIIAAAGIAEGEKAKFYIGDVYKSEEKTALRDAAATLNANVESMLNIDLYALSKEGIRGANALTEEIQIEITLPGRLNGQIVTLVTIIGGEVCELEDMDENPATFTLSAKNLGSFAIVTK